MTLEMFVASLMAFMTLFLFGLAVDYLVGTAQYLSAFRETISKMETTKYSDEKVTYRVKHLRLEFEPKTQIWNLFSDRSLISISMGTGLVKGLDELEETLKKDLYPQRMVRLSSRWKTPK